MVSPFSIKRLRAHWRFLIHKKLLISRISGEGMEKWYDLGFDCKEPSRWSRAMVLKLPNTFESPAKLQQAGCTGLIWTSEALLGGTQVSVTFRSSQGLQCTAETCSRWGSGPSPASFAQRSSRPSGWSRDQQNYMCVLLCCPGAATRGCLPWAQRGSHVSIYIPFLKNRSIEV